MKKIFGLAKKADQDREQAMDYNEREYDWDSMEGEDMPCELETDFESEEYADGDEEGYLESDEYADGDEEDYLESEEYADGDEEGYLESEEYADGDEEGYLESEEYADEDEEDYLESEEYADGDEEGYLESEEYADGDEGGCLESEEYAEEGGEIYLESEEYADGDGEGYLESEEYADGDEEGYLESEEYADGDEEGYYEQEEYAEDEEDILYAAPAAGRMRGPSSAEDENSGYGKEGFLAKIGGIFRGMDVMDRVMLVTGAGVLALAIVVVSMFFSSRTVERQVEDFVSVGTQLDGITVIGERGLMSVANAQAAKLAAAEVTPSPEPTEEPSKEYDEKDYDRQVTVEPDFTSIQKDLKIKFVNTKTNKLVANVPFSVTIVDPDGNNSIWSDDDMDGIITKKDLKPGKYKVTLEALSDSKYAGYILSTLTRTVEVKKEIAYSKVDVTNEVKTESEVNATKEDTRKNETVVESVLNDTVAWVESKVIETAYNEVPKSSIPDPAAIAMGNGIMRAALTLVSENTEPNPGEESPGSSAEPTAEPTPEPTAEPTPEPTAEPTAEPTQEPTQAPPTPTPAPVRGSLSVDNASLSGIVGGTLKAKATATGFDSVGDTLGSVKYTVSSSAPAVASAAVDGSGNISITGVAQGTAIITVTANYEKGSGETAAAATISVTIGGNKTLTLDKTSLTVFLKTPGIINADIKNALSASPVVTAESSNTGVAVVSVDNKAVTVTGVAEGSAIITVKYTENGEEVRAACTVTVMTHPSEDKKTPLKKADGTLIYVLENNAYREAVSADYYTADKFFEKAPAKYTGWQTIGGKVYYYTAEGKPVTGEQVIQGAKYNFASDGSLVVGNGVMGIDVSKWNGNIDWNAVKNSGVSYVIIRCGYRGSSQGQMIEDPKFQANIKGASAAGLKIGIYFFSQAVDEVEAVEEASMVLGQIRNYTISYPVFIDVEASGGRADAIDRTTRTAVCKAFCQTIQNAGYTAGIYANKTWLETKIDTGSLSAYKIWLAQYAAEPTYSGRYDLWQYRSTGNVSGISGNVDMNISYLGY